VPIVEPEVTLGESSSSSTGSSSSSSSRGTACIWSDGFLNCEGVSEQQKGCSCLPRVVSQLGVAGLGPCSNTKGRVCVGAGGGGFT